MATKSCPKCQSEMERGFVAVRVRPGRRVVSAWVEGEARTRLWGTTKVGTRKSSPISTYRCTRCNLLEHYAER